jgi:integrase
MARQLHKLTPAKVKNAAVGTYADGGNLYLQVTAGTAGANGKPTLRKSWVFRWAEDGKDRYMGLGAAHTVGLAEAREKARKARLLRLDGIDPIQHRDDRLAALKLELAKAMSFRECAEAYIRTHRAGWRSVLHAADWEASLGRFVYPQIGALPVQAIDTALVMKVLEPIWNKIPDSANRLRTRIERILDWAKARGYREGENPARWKGHMKNLLPAVSKVRRAGNHAALPYPEIGKFMAVLRDEAGVASRALQFLILTATRSGEALGARWEEIDLDARLWVIPADRMKAGREHRVPLSEAACDLLRQQAAVREGAFVFPGRTRATLRNMALHHVLERIKRDDVTIHGFRSTFRDWAAEETSFPREVAEMALAHLVGDETERAYWRGDVFQKRRQLMDAWADYCGAAQ